MATTTSITSTYTGEFAKQYIQAALLAAPTLGNQTITFKPNIKYKSVVKKLVSSGTILQDATCDFTPLGTITLTERVLEPKQIEVNIQLCKKDFISDWEAIEMGYSAWDVLPKNFSDFLIGNISQTVAGSIESSIWAGTNTTGSFSGFTTLFKADSTVLDVSGTTITAANVQAELAKVVAKLATTNIYSQGVKPVIYAATDVVMNYLISLGGYAASGVGANGYKGEGPTGVQNAPLDYAGIEIIAAPGLPTSQMVGAQAQNLWFGTGLLEDFNNVKVLDMADLDASDNVRFAMRFSAGVQYGIGAEIVFYWIY